MGVADPSTSAPPEVGTAGAAPALAEVLDDLAMRFVVNCPAEEQESFERLLFQVEAAFWFYEDQYREIWPHAFPSLTLLTFAQRMFKSCPLLSPFEHKTKEIYDAFTTYKQQIPTCGAMLLNASCTKLLLVKSYNGKSWGFPKGKIDKDEDKESCAIREVLEEVGYDISALLDPVAYIETQWKEQVIRLYIVAGVPDDTTFVTRTKKEIGEIAWQKLKELPGSTEAANKDESKKKFWMVVPFIAKLRRYLAEQEKQKKKLKGQKSDKANAPSAQPVKSAANAPSATDRAAAPAPSATAPSVPLGVKSRDGKGRSKGGGASSGGPSVGGTSAPAGAVQVLRRNDGGRHGTTTPHPFLRFAFDVPPIVAALDVR